jgi:hypothetical protein
MSIIEELDAWLAANQGKTENDFWSYRAAIFDAKPFLEKYGNDPHSPVVALKRLASAHPGIKEDGEYEYLLMKLKMQESRQLDEHMFANHPMLFRTTSLGCGGINNYQRLRGLGTEAPAGWYNIIDEGCDKIEDAIKGTNIKPVWLCLKQKFGTMRPWLAYEEGAPRPTGEVAGAINEALRWMEAESSRTCEICGKPGTLDESQAWICTLCPEHTKENENGEDQG